MTPFDFPFRNGEFKSWALPLFKRSLPLDMSDLVIYDDIIHNCPFLINKNESVLVIGGGASTLSIKDSEALDSHEYIWSMNKAYKLDWLRNKISLLGVGAGVDLEEEDFQNFVDEVNPVLAFEIHPKWFSEKEKNNIRKLNSRQHVFGYHTHIYGKIGMGVRLINLAAAIGAGSVSFIGLDGPEAILKGQHAFEPGKKELPSFCNESNAHQIHKDQYRHFWEYIKNKYPVVNFNSIDKDNVYHQCLAVNSQ